MTASGRLRTKQDPIPSDSQGQIKFEPLQLINLETDGMLNVVAP